MARRTGLATLRDLAHKICRGVVFFTPLIKHVYPSSPLLIVALEAANVACAELVAQADLTLEEGI